MNDCKQGSSRPGPGKFQLLQQLHQAVPEARLGELAALLQLEQVRIGKDAQARNREPDPVMAGEEDPETQLPSPAATGRPAYPPVAKEVLFFYLHGLEYRAQENISQEIPQAYLDAEPFTDTGFSRLGREIDPEPLSSWQEIWPLLHTLLSRANKTSRLDEEEIIRKVVRQQPITAIPWQKKNFWNREIVLLVDFSPHLSPWFRDYLLVAEKMEQWFRGRLQLVICRDSEEQRFLFQGRQYDEFPVQGENLQILYLGDLGFLDRQGISAACYYFLGRELAQHQARVQALLTVDVNDWDPDFQRYFQMYQWDRGLLSAQPARPGRGSSSREQVKHLLAALSPAFEICPALVRKIRFLLGLTVSVESLVLQEGSLIGNGLAFQWRNEEVRQRWYERLDPPPAIRAEILQIIEDFEIRLPVELQVEQRQMNNRPLSREQKTVLRRLVRSGQHNSLPGSAQEMLCNWLARMGVRRAGDTQWHPELRNLYYWYWQKKQPAGSLPLAVDLTAMPGWIEKTEPNKQITVREQAGRLVFSSSLEDTGSRPLLTGFSANSHCEVFLISRDDQGKGVKDKQPLPMDGVLDLPDRLQEVCITSKGEHYSIQSMTCPAWAVAIGWDRYGLFTEVRVKGVSFVLRWLPPGRFLMGSPDDEPERLYDEGPQHEVRFSQGFWLAETACSQQLWQAVMGENPSRFTRSPQNPVESVGRKKVLKFIKKLNSHLPGLNLRLPSEAEWEYGCRAGTTSPFWFGNELTVAQANYDGNLPYNNGKKGKYREKTVPVKSFQANPWGLYQMHGNVLEWCQDCWHDNYKGAPDDGSVWQGGDEATPVARGGSWLDHGWSLRSACRSRWFYDVVDAGFRLARGPEKQVR